MTTTVVHGDVLDDWLAERHRLGQDRHDEVWQGVYHVAPFARAEHDYVVFEVAAALRGPARRAGLTGGGGFNLGDKDDYRVPDAGWHDVVPVGLYLPTAVAVLEVLSPDDETYAKFDFYAHHDVREVLVAHPGERWVRCWALRHDGVGGHEERERSQVFGVAVTELIGQIAWP